MICDDCQGTGASWDEDGENPAPCAMCDGTGDIPLRIWIGDKWYEHVGMRWDSFCEWLRFTPIGNRWWRRYGKERRARRLAESKTLFQLQALHGERLNRLRKWADFIEQDEYDVGHCYRAETRLVAEAARACEIKAERERMTTRKASPKHKERN